MGRKGWRIYKDGEHIATTYADQYTEEEVRAQYPNCVLVPITLERDNRY